MRSPDQGEGARCHGAGERRSQQFDQHRSRIVRVDRINRARIDPAARRRQGDGRFGRCAGSGGRGRFGLGGRIADTDDLRRFAPVLQQHADQIRYPVFGPAGRAALLPRRAVGFVGGPRRHAASGLVLQRRRCFGYGPCGSHATGRLCVTGRLATARKDRHEGFALPPRRVEPNPVALVQRVEISRRDAVFRVEFDAPVIRHLSPGRTRRARRRGEQSAYKKTAYRGRMETVYRHTPVSRRFSDRSIVHHRCPAIAL